MATREFRDSDARTWTVWEVQPSAAAPGRRAAVKAEYARGWLTCETLGEKRRITPIPAGWEELTDAELEALCRAGTLVRPVAPRNRIGRPNPRTAGEW